MIHDPDVDSPTDPPAGPDPEPGRRLLLCICTTARLWLERKAYVPAHDNSTAPCSAAMTDGGEADGVV